MTRLGRARDWLSEPRLPHHLPFWLWRLARYPAASAASADRPVRLALTFDIEHDLGTFGRPDEWGACPPFLRWLSDAFGERGWRTSLYVQGSLVEPLADLLQPFRDGHEIGLHGYFHELWGRRLWFSPQPGTPLSERTRLLERGVAAFPRAGLVRPRSFRAPNLVCDDETLGLLERHGFTVDSSASSFRGALPLPERWGRLRRVPVSAGPRPRIRRRYGLPTWAQFELLNLQTLLQSPEEQLLRLVDEILAVQDRAGVPRHLVAFGHPWEFSNLPSAGASPDHRGRLIARVELLARHLPLRMSTVEEIAAEVL